MPSIPKTSLSLALALAAAAGHAEDATVVRIAHVGPVSGSQAHFGKDNENGVRLAIDDLNARHLVIGGRKVRFELVAEDDGADPKQGTAVAQKLCDLKVNGVVGHFNSGTTIPASKIYAECGLPHISPGASNPKLTQNGYRTTFRDIANDNSLGAGLALHAARNLGLKTVAVIDDRTAYGQGVAEVFRKVAVDNGMKVVDSQYTSDKAADFMAILTAVKSRHPDAIFYGGMDAQAGPMIRQMAQLGMTDVRFFGGDGLCTAKLVELSDNAKIMDHVVCAEAGKVLEKVPAFAAWKARYDAAYPGEFQLYSPYAYDAAMLLADAMVRANSVDPKAYLPALAAADYAGITARIQFDAFGDLKTPAMTLYTFRDGKKTAL